MGSNENRVPHHETPTLGNPDLPPEGMVTTTGDPASTKMAGPQNPVLESQFPNQITAPGTDISTQPFFWSSFNISPRRQQRGGWARELTQQDFAISDEIAGVNMYLEPGGIRELHWHQTAEWAIMTEGKCRITTLSRDGLPSVEDVFKEDLWFFPAGGSSRPGCRIPCRHSARTARSSCSRSTAATSPRATRCC
ncbi:MAG: cupin domain-containing protein [Streptosporangiaceae bacterium]